MYFILRQRLSFMAISFTFLTKIACYDYPTFVQVTDSGHETFAKG